MAAPKTIAGNQLQFRDDARLNLRYVLVDELILLEGNPKLHDLGALYSSIVENGFLDPPKWDCNLNGGAGGIVEGNGRAEALKWGQDEGQSPPRGIGLTKDDRWAAPVIFGCDSRSEAAAQRYAIDHNNLVLAGGNFTALDIANLYNIDAYLAQLEDLSQSDDLPLTVDGSDLEMLQKLTAGTQPEQPGNPVQPPEEFPEYGEGIPVEHTCPRCGYQWSGKTS